LGGENAIAVVNLRTGQVEGRIPTAWYPTSINLSRDEKILYVFNIKSTPGPNPGGGGGDTNTAYSVSTNPTFQNQFIQALMKSSLMTLPIPDAKTLLELSGIVDKNNGFTGTPNEVSSTMGFLQGRIKHVIYIMKENRSYDQMLGDLSVGNGDPRLAFFPRNITPNLHALAEEFVDLDNFYCSNENSGDGWQWVTQGHGNEYAEVVDQFTLATWGALDFLSLLGTPRGLNLALSPTTSDPNPDLTKVRATGLFDPTGSSTILPGPKEIAVTWGADDEDRNQTGGYLWDSVLRAGKTVRDYGLWGDSAPYYEFNGNLSNDFCCTSNPKTPDLVPIVRNAAAKGIVQAAPIAPGLIGHMDPYYRGWDLNVPDEYRYEEWKREFDQYVKDGNLPAFEPMLMMMDHTGNFGSNVAGLNTPELDLASNDHAIGLLVDAVSHSPYWKDTAIFIVEDDTLDGPDHVEAHRSPGYVISAYTKRHKVVSTFYNTVSMVRTIADLLGVDHLGLNDANAISMDDVFMEEPDLTPYNHIIPGNLLQPPVDPNLVTQEERNDPKIPHSSAVLLRHDSQWWAAQTKGMNFSRPDALDPVAFNVLLWRGIVGDNIPVPAVRSGVDLRNDRTELLRRTHVPVLSVQDSQN